MNKKLLLILMLLLPISCFAQKQGNIWYFGNHAGLDFNSGSASTLLNGQTYLQSGYLEGTSVISDSSGALLFYSNGEKIWNKNHQVMPNGDSLYGSFSATQSSLIIADPGQERFFYIFTLDDFNHDLLNGFRYSVIDMCLDNGSGDVVLSQKNLLLLDSAGEKLTGARHANGIDYWVIVHKYYSDAFYAYLVNSNGISNPVISHIGSVHSSTAPHPVAAIGCMKVSPDGSRIALASSNGGHLRELFNFDNSTGIVSNFINLHAATDSTEDSYGVSFSPDNSKLYMTWNIKTLQYDLNAGGGNPIAIRNSKTIINPLSSSNNYGMQLGPDGKIYVTQYGASKLNIINNPNVAGMACNYIDTAISLGGKICSYGLPNFIDSYDYSNTSVYCEATGIGEMNDVDQMLVFPNPCSNELNIETNQISNFILYDLSSKKLFQQSFINSATISMQQLAKGVYLYEVRNLNGTTKKGKVVKQ